MSYWEKGIVVGLAPSGSLKYVASSYDVLNLDSHGVDAQNLKLGSCIEFRAVRMSGCSDPFYSRRIVEFQKCDDFLPWAKVKDRNAVMLFCHIVEVTEKYHPAFEKTVKCLRTDFLEEVFDGDLSCPRAHGYSDAQLLNMKVVAIRYVDNATKKTTWSVLKLLPSIEKIGFIFSAGTTKHGKDELYVWVPGRPRDVMFPVHLRKNIPREQFYGKWVSFSMKNSVFMGDDSIVQEVNDLLPTRLHCGRYEVRVPVEFNSKNQNQRNNELNSDMCGIIVDCENVLQKYDRLDSFSESAWVHNFFYDSSRNIRFILSDKQEEWERPQREQFNRDRDEYSENVETVSSTNNFSDSGVSENKRYLEDIQDKLKELRMEHDFFMENGGGVPRKLLDDLKNTEAEEQRMRNNRRKNYEENDMEEDWKSNKKMEKREVEDEDFRDYEKLVVLFRGMLSSKRVNEEMNRYDPSLLHKINQRIRDL